MRALGFDVDAELLTFLVEVASLEAEYACGLGDVIPVGLEFREHDLAFEGHHTIREGAAACTEADLKVRRYGVHVTSRENLPRGRTINHIISQQQQALHHVAQLANIPRPRIPCELLDRLGAERARLPAVLLGHD